jgi:hypothetical protein
MARALIIEESVDIACTADALWAMVTDYSSDRLWRPGIAEMTPDPPGPPAVGTRVREVLQSGKRGFVTQSTVTEVGPGMTYRFSGSGTTGKVEGSRTVAAIGADAATFTYRVEITLAGSFRLMRPLVATTMKKGLEGDLARLRELLERPGGAGG